MSRINPFVEAVVSSLTASVDPAMPAEPALTPALRVNYTTLRKDEPLGDDVLAAIVFGATTPCPDDPRCLRVDLEPLAGGGLVEVWRGTAPARIGTTGMIRHVDDGRCLAGWIELDEQRVGGLAAASEAAYRGLLQLQTQSPYRHVWRIWNFITDINEGEGDAERYKLFCLGRSRAFAAMHARAPDISYPAASAVGKRGARSLQVCWLAGRDAGTTLENPCQINAYDYPRQYGPAAPNFSRATLTRDRLLLISGTASIVGHASVHLSDAAAQLEETLNNLDNLLRHARTNTGFGSAELGSGSLVKVYLREPADVLAVERRLRERIGHEASFLVLAADICRSELLLEIEVVQRGVQALSA